MKARKLKTGGWICQVWIKRKDGTVDRSSFTAATKTEAERLANEYKYAQDRRKDQKYTVGEALDTYIEAKREVLSPSTHLTYTRQRKRYYGRIENYAITDLTNLILQGFVSSLYAEGKSTKTVKNIWNLLTGALNLVVPDRKFSVTFRAPDAPNTRIPTDAEVRILLENAPENLRKAILLSSAGTMRRGEICAIKYKDISRDLNRISVHADMVKGIEGTWVYKQHPKTSTSIRMITYPRFVIDELGDGDPDAFVITCNPDTISHRFEELKKKTGINCRFHDLRGYAASTMMADGVPRSYIEQVGGWSKGSTVLDKHYYHTIEEKEKSFAAAAVERYEKNILSTTNKTLTTGREAL